MQIINIKDFVKSKHEECDAWLANEQVVLEKIDSLKMKRKEIDDELCMVEEALTEYTEENKQAVLNYKAELEKKLQEINGEVVEESVTPTEPIESCPADHEANVSVPAAEISKLPLDVNSNFLNRVL